MPLWIDFNNLFWFKQSLFVMIAWLSMAVDPTAIPGRISMVMMTLLTLMAMFSGVRQNTPKVRYGWDREIAILLTFIPCKNISCYVEIYILLSFFRSATLATWITGWLCACFSSSWCWLSFPSPIPLFVRKWGTELMPWIVFPWFFSQSFL